MRVHSFCWLGQFFLSLTLSLLWYSEISPSRHFNSKHAGVGGRGVNHLFKFYGQGAFASKLPEPDGQIKGNGRKGFLLLKRSFKSSFGFPSHLSPLLAKESWTLIHHQSSRKGRENTLAKGLCSTMALSLGGCKRLAQNMELFTNVGTRLCFTVSLLCFKFPIILLLPSSHFLYSEVGTGIREPKAHFQKFLRAV